MSDKKSNECRCGDSKGIPADENHETATGICFCPCHSPAPKSEEELSKSFYSKSPLSPKEESKGVGIETVGEALKIIKFASSKLQESKEKEAWTGEFENGAFRGFPEKYKQWLIPFIRNLIRQSRQEVVQEERERVLNDYKCDGKHPKGGCLLEKINEAVQEYKDELVSGIEDKDLECFEQIKIKADIINLIKQGK